MLFISSEYETVLMTMISKYFVGFSAVCVCIHVCVSDVSEERLYLEIKLLSEISVQFSSIAQSYLIL